MTIVEALRAAARRLAETSDTARLDAEVLMAHALGVSRSEFLLRHMGDPVPEGFAPLVERRAAHEPVAYITGTQEFYGLELVVTPEVLIPRADSETLVEAAFDAFATRQPPERVCDLGAGTGALLLAVLDRWKWAEGTAVDASEAALVVAQGNAEQLGLAGRCTFACRNWREAGWADGLGQFGFVLCNPPYVEESADLDPSVREFEPAGALFSGPEGLDDYRILIPQLPALLADDGAAILEIGHRQTAAVSKIAQAAGFAASVRQDLGGRDRAIILQKMH